MPPHRYRLDGPRDDLWKENKTTFRRLYLKEHKTLKDVKRVMESEHGFPKTPLSTYESKLRDLGLRKKMKRKDWYTVYKHYVDSGNRHTAMFFNGTRIPWDKAWKEIRRSGARESIEGPSVVLPTDVIMRTPSPALVAQNFFPRYYYRPPPIPWHISDAPLVDLSLEAVFLRLRLYDVPSNLLRIEMLSTMQQSPANILLESNESRAHYPSLNATDKMIEYTSVHMPSVVSLQSSDNTGHNFDIDRLSSALYRLANGEVRYFARLDGRLDESVDVVLNQTPKYILLKILERNSPTVRASVETLLREASDLGRKSDVRNVIEAVARRHPEWVVGDAYLPYTALVGCVDSCRLLLQLRVQHRFKGDHYLCHCHYGSDYLEAVFGSVAYGHVECAKMLCQHAIALDPTILQPGEITAHDIFCSLLAAVANGFCVRTNKVPLDLGNPVVSQTLNWFLDAGANVDLPARFDEESDPSYIRYTPPNWRPTILDHIFFKNAELYSHIVGRSTKFLTEPTRSGIYLSAKQGIDSLRMYLLSRPSHTSAQKDAFVDILLGEELLRRSESPRTLDFDVIHALLHHNISLPKFFSDLHASVMLYCVVRAAVLQGVHPAVHHIIKILTQKGAVIGAEVIDQAVEAKGTVLLQALSSCDADFGGKGALALCTAAQLDNYDAVNLLFDMEVDINVTLRHPNEGEGSTILARARRMRRPIHEICGHQFSCTREYSSPIRSAMLEYLVSRKLNLEANSSNISRQQFLLQAIKHIESIDLKDEGRRMKILTNFRWLFNAEISTHDPSSTKPCPLEAFFHYEDVRWPIGDPGNASIIAQMVPIIELMLEYGVPVRQSGVLAHLIYAGAQRDEVQRVLDSGVDINAYSGQGLRGEDVWRRTPMQAAASIGSLDWVQFLLQMGADVNQPAKGHYGITALQAACGGGYGNIDLIKLLIGHGADVNAPPSEGGLTALQATCDSEPNDIDLVKFLIDNGADVNAPPSGVEITALQAACRGGHENIDSIKCLIENGADVNALPSKEGPTALQSAAGYGDFEVAVLLLENGADINAPGRGLEGLCALDEAADRGKLDMAQFLLDMGAFSDDRGESGYRGAIREAETRRNWAVADIIRQHALKNGKSGEELSKPSSQWEDDSSSEHSFDLDSTDESETGSNAGSEDLLVF